MAPRNRRLLLPLLVLLLLLAGAVHSASNDRRASTVFHPAAAFLAPITSPCSSPSTAGNKEPQAPPAVQVAVDKPLPLTRRCRRPSSRRNALPPFDTPLDPAAIEAMVQQAAQQAQQTPVPQGMGEVTTEQLWVGFVAGVFPFVWAGYEFWKRIDTQQRTYWKWTACLRWTHGSDIHNQHQTQTIRLRRLPGIRAGVRVPQRPPARSAPEVLCLRRLPPLDGAFT